MVSPFFKVKHYQWLTFFVATLLVLRLILSLTHPNYLGIDGGAYVLSALRVQGLDHTSVGFPRPLLAPGWLLVPFIKYLGIDAGYKIWTSVFSVLPLLPVYLLTRHLISKRAAIFAVAFFSVDMMQMEMMVTGSLPLIGFTCIGMALWAILNLTEYRFSHLHFWTLVASVGILPYINQTATGIAAILLPVATVSAFFFIHKEKGAGKAGPYQVNIVIYVLPAAFLGFLIALGALPWYLANTPGNPELRFPGPLITPIQLGDPAWAQIAVSIGLIYLLLKHQMDYRMKVLTLLIGVLTFLMAFLSWDEAIINILYRSRYMIGLLFYPAVAYLMERHIFPILPDVRKEWMVVFPMGAMWLALLGMQVVAFHNQTMLKDMVKPATVEALAIARQNNPDKAIITNAYSLSHWVAALNQVESPNTWTLEPSPYYKTTDRNVRCLLGWVVGCDAQSATQALNASYILTDERWPSKWEHPVWGSPERHPWDNLSQVPWLHLKFSGDGIKLWEIDRSF